MRKLGMGLLMMMSLSACAKADTLEVTINGHIFQCEVAANDTSRAQGLMNRRSMAADHGMLFVFERDQMLSFWMKNTLIPLSIAYIDRNGIIRDIKDMEPLSLSSVTSSVPVRYALELNQGAFAGKAIKVGDKVSFNGLP